MSLGTKLGSISSTLLSAHYSNPDRNTRISVKNSSPCARLDLQRRPTAQSRDSRGSYDAWEASLGIEMPLVGLNLNFAMDVQAVGERITWFNIG